MSAKGQIPILLPRDLRRLIEDAAKAADCSIAEEVRRRLWFSFYKNADELELLTAERRIVFIENLKACR